jgi:3-dehydroquinate dehydratase-2
MKILLVNGPNLNRIGIRHPEIYGNQRFEDFLEELRRLYPEVELEYFQSNHEGALIDFLQARSESAQGLIINGGGLSHTSVSLADAVADTGLSAIEVHISDVYSREAFRQHSYLQHVCIKQINGMGLPGYKVAVDYFLGK